MVVKTSFNIIGEGLPHIGSDKPKHNPGYKTKFFSYRVVPLSTTSLIVMLGVSGKMPN